MLGPLLALFLRSARGNPIVSLAGGLFVVSLVLYGLVSGRAVSKGFIHRTQSPFEYWAVIVTECALAGLLFGLAAHGD